jgi:hypothetical protein
MPKFHSALHNFSATLNRIVSHGIALAPGKDINYLKFAEKKKAYQVSSYQSSYRELISSLSELNMLDDEDNKDKVYQIKSRISKLKEYYEKNSLPSLVTITSELLDLESELNYSGTLKSVNTSSSLSFKLPKLPLEIAADMQLDAKELEKCFSAGCFRAAVILCGRLLETSLHRKYFEATKQDILEKSPGIGLGNLIARMKEQNIPLDPAIAQQIHLINQVRIYSVHTKKEAFYPTKDQTHAIILYTLDIIRKLLS